MTMGALALLVLALTAAAAATVAELAVGDRLPPLRGELLGPNGKLVWRYAGSLDDEPHKALSSEVSRLLSAK